MVEKYALLVSKRREREGEKLICVNNLDLAGEKNVFGSQLWPRHVIAI